MGPILQNLLYASSAAYHTLPNSILFFISIRSASPLCCSPYHSEKPIIYEASAIRAEGPLNLVVETRDALLQKLQNNKNAQIENSSLDASKESGEVSELKRENVSSEEKVSEIANAAEGLEIAGEENAEQWLEEADISSGSSVNVKKNLEHEEDVSFSDLEDDDNYLSNRE
ncbi:hypothetical protein CRYUN_Cryun03dG0074700 [Craigia yunnanensis]